jgi:hypothetical protein
MKISLIFLNHVPNLLHILLWGICSIFCFTDYTRSCFDAVGFYGFERRWREGAWWCFFVVVYVLLHVDT